MRIPAHFIKKWKSLMEVGDKKKLQEITKKTQPVITKVFKEEEASLGVFEAIKEFYNEREKKINA